MIQFNDLTSKSLMQDLSDKEAMDILGGTDAANQIVKDLRLITESTSAVTIAQINSSISISTQTASRQIAKRFSDGLQQTAR